MWAARKVRPVAVNGSEGMARLIHSSYRRCRRRLATEIGRKQMSRLCRMNDIQPPNQWPITSEAPRRQLVQALQAGWAYHSGVIFLSRGASIESACNYGCTWRDDWNDAFTWRFDRCQVKLFVLPDTLRSKFRFGHFIQLPYISKFPPL